MDVPPPTTDYTVTRVRVPMRDGVELVGDHYAPTGAAKGTVLVRCPYGRTFPTSTLYGMAYAARGYHVLLQSVRGTFGSGGVFEPMVHEIADGADTVAWLRDQPWFTGSFATMGLSYLGFTQWALLVDPPPELKAAIIAVGPHDFAQSSWGTGSFTLANFLGWSDMMAHQEDPSRLRSLLRQMRTPKAVTRTAAEVPAGAAGRALLGSGARWYESWLSHPDTDDPFWESMALDAALDTVDVPVLLFSGWQDLFLEQSLTQFQRLRSRGVTTALTIGSWTHTQVITRGGARVLRESLDWLEGHLAGGSVVDRPAVHAEINHHGWVPLPHWPPAVTDMTLYLAPSQQLSANPPEATDVPSTFTFDPADPTPTVGGRLLSGKGGYLDDAALAERGDTVVFTGAPLPADVDLLGTPVIELAHSCDNPYRDVFVRISEIDARGRSRNLSDGFQRLTGDSDGSQPIRLELDAVGHRLRAGSRIRVLIAGGCHPRYARNLGTDEPYATGRHLVPATHRIHFGAESRLTLPVTEILSRPTL
ncbi:MAG: CocE/NonD family hydrolase [Mycobacterium sp.]